ncbi:MAG: hypothetical protein ACRD59_07110 [Candidatus Acidiferrales bacterium]
MKQLLNRRWLKTALLSRAATGLAHNTNSAYAFLLIVFCSIAVAMPGCAGSTSRSTGPGSVTIKIVPASANLFLGQTQQFQASVTGASNTTVTWFAGGVLGGNASTGTISPTGLYAAPSVMPAAPTITVTASSNANPEATDSVAVSLKDDVAVGISPTTAMISTNAGQAFTATVSGTGSPSTAVTWSVNGIAGGNSTVGTVASNGIASALYVAPAVPPSPPVVSLIATSVADPTKAATASVTITCPATNSISPPSATVALAQTQSFTASFCLAPGASISWDVNGISGGNSTVGTIVPSGANAALYSAPTLLPSPNTVTIHAANGSTTAAASVTLTSNIGVTVAPASATMALSQRKSFAAALTNTADTTVTWLVNGISNGNPATGQICQSGSNPCIPPAAPISGSIDYLAPASVPPTDPVTLTAVSHADPSKSGSAIVAITGIAGPVSLTVSPLYAFVPHSTGTLSSRQFFATVSGNGDLNVTWSVQSAVAGQGCSGTACGSVDGNGLFTAPSVAPSPNAISIVATSEADNTKSAAATIAITSGPTIEVILPSSVMAGAVEGFPLAVQGVNFAAGSGSSGSVILVNGTARGTACATKTSCATALNPADVQSATTLTVQVKNPNSPGLLSNPVPFVIVPFNVSEDLIALSPSQPSATTKDITVVEPTTAAASAALDVDFDGFLMDSTCEVEGTPLSVTHPSSGSTTVSICIHGNGLDPTFTYAFTGPGAAPGDIPVTASAITGLFPNTIELDFQISSTTLPGVRTLFITTLNNDQASATGILEVK